MAKKAPSKAMHHLLALDEIDSDLGDLHEPELEAALTNKAVALLTSDPHYTLENLTAPAREALKLLAMDIIMKECRQTNESEGAALLTSIAKLMTAYDRSLAGSFVAAARFDERSFLGLKGSAWRKYAAGKAGR